MSAERNPESGSGRRRAERGPQGTQVFSREQVAELLADARGDGESPSLSRDVPQLVGISSATAGQSFPLTDDRVVLGRSAFCDIVINEASLSSEHARFSLDGDHWRVTNLLSTNGIFVNRRKVFSARLADGDRIRLGRLEFRFSDPAGRRAAGSDWGRTATWLIALAATVIGLGGLAVWLL